MKINSNPISKALGIYKSQKPNGPRAEGKGQYKKDQVVFSREAQAFQIALKAVQDSPDVRMAKVEDIKARMEAGQYHVSSRDIAEKMVDDILSNPSL